jgi:HSP20 family protein
MPDSPALDALFDEPERWADGVLSPDWLQVGSPAAADVWETQDELVLELELPGCDSSSVDVSVDGDQLTVSAQPPDRSPEDAQWLHVERAHGLLRRSFRLPPDFDAGHCDAKFELGVLTVRVPRRPGAQAPFVDAEVS